MGSCAGKLPFVSPFEQGLIASRYAPVARSRSGAYKSTLEKRAKACSAFTRLIPWHGYLADFILKIPTTQALFRGATDLPSLVYYPYTSLAWGMHEPRDLD